MSNRLPRIGITMGDPSGIGSEVILDAYPDLQEMADVLVIGDADVLRQAKPLVGPDIEIRAIDDISEHEPGTPIDVIDLDNVGELEYGVVREAYGQASLEYVERAIELAHSGAIDGITTAPIHKQATKMAGSEHSGHTGLLADRTGTENYSMMLVEEDLRVSHVSTHVSLPTACSRVTEQHVFQTIQVTANALKDLGIDDPTIAVAGLNPHASDNGLMGTKEATEIRPAVVKANAAGIDTFGPESPDTIFVRAADGEADCVVAMYHDQGHIPIKMLGFADGDAVSGVNVTIGLPIVRTSVDHGTAFDIAGKGVASAKSMKDAVAVATRLAQRDENES